MGYALLDRPNPYGDHFYEERLLALTAITVHITAGLEDLDGVDDHSAENTTSYACTTSTQVSWHSGSDADSYMYLLPASYTAWHASAYNSSTYGHEISKKHTDWRVMPADWVEKTLRNAAKCLAPIVVAHKIPIRKASRAEVDRARVTGVPCGFISHSELQPQDRTDPGWVKGVDTFPWARFFELIRLYVGGGTPEQEEEEMGYSFSQVALDNTAANEVVEREILLPDFGGGAGVDARWVRVHGPGQPFVDSRQLERHFAIIELAHYLDDQGRIVGHYVDDNYRLDHHETAPSSVPPVTASKLVIRYMSRTGLNVSVQVKTA